MDDEYTDHEYHEYYEFLNGLRESGKTNMFGAVPYLKREFPWLNNKEAETVLLSWMNQYQG